MGKSLGNFPGAKESSTSSQLAEIGLPLVGAGAAREPIHPSTASSFADANALNLPKVFDDRLPGVSLFYI